MYDFSKHLDEDEKILVQGASVPGKGHKNIFGAVFLMAFSSIIMIIMTIALKYSGDEFKDVKIFFYACVFFFTIGVYMLIYNLFIKRKKVADDMYCLTNKRVFKYESKKDELIYGYLAYYEQIFCENTHKGYGDITFSVNFGRLNYSDDSSPILNNLVINPNPQNMPFIGLECVENPYNIEHLAQDARKKILEENDFNITNMF